MPRFITILVELFVASLFLTIQHTFRSFCFYISNPFFQTSFLSNKKFHRGHPAPIIELGLRAGRTSEARDALVPEAEGADVRRGEVPAVQPFGDSVMF